MVTKKYVRQALTATGAIAVLLASAACSGGSAASSTEYTLWDPYPQHDESSPWAARIDACGVEAGVTVKRTPYDSQALTNQSLLAAQEGTAADIILLDNPGVSTLAGTGALNDMESIGLDTGDIGENLLGPGVLDGLTYGIPVGANTLALYYNQDILTAAGVDPTSITDWDSLTLALEQVVAAGHQGITFAGFASEEATFQFLPFFWGSGAELDKLDSPEAVSALTLWTNWLNDGLAPNSVITNSQNTTWEEFLTGDFGFVVNGTWQVNSAAEQDFETGFITIPGKDGGAASAPTGGEFMLIPVQSDESRYDTSKEIVECMSTTEGQVETATTFKYYIPATVDGQSALLESNPELSVWVDAVQEARGRTSELGSAYPEVSEQVWTAVQNALSGSLSPEEALSNAQEAAAKATAK